MMQGYHYLYQCDPTSKLRAFWCLMICSLCRIQRRCLHVVRSVRRVIDAAHVSYSSIMRTVCGTSVKTRSSKSPIRVVKEDVFQVLLQLVFASPVKTM